MDRDSNADEPEPASACARFLTTVQVARMAGVLPTTVARACANKEMTAALREGPAPVQDRHSRGRKRRKIWEIEPASGRAWARDKLQQREFRAQLRAYQVSTAKSTPPGSGVLFALRGITSRRASAGRRQ
jgi:hypothetical protein